MGVTVNPISGGGGLSAPINAVDIADGSVSNTEFQYLNGVTSNIQTQVDAKLTILTAKVETDVSVTGFDASSADLVNLTLPVGTYSYRGTLILYSSDYENRGLICDVYNSGGGTLTVDGTWQLIGQGTPSSSSTTRNMYRHMDANTKIANVNEIGTMPALYGKVEVEGLATVTTADATLSIKIGKDDGGISTVTIFKGSKIDFIKQ